jgi:hypothetical protein
MHRTTRNIWRRLYKCVFAAPRPPPAAAFMRLHTGHATDDEGLPLAGRMCLVSAATSRSRPCCRLHLQPTRRSVLQLCGYNGTVRFLLQTDSRFLVQPDFCCECVVNTRRRYWQQQQACARKGVNLTPELYIIKSVLGAIDPMYNNLD